MVSHADFFYVSLTRSAVPRRGPIIDGAALCAVIRSRHAARIAQAEFTSAEHFNSQRVPTKCKHFVGCQKQLDDLCIACTKTEAE